MFEGDISAIYMGARINEAPTPSPPIILAITSSAKEGAIADKSADIKYNTAATFRTVLLPNRSLSGPATIIARVEVNVSDPTAQPSWNLVRENSGSINPTTPDITDASKPIKKPPRATVMAIRVTNICFLFIK
jgi:hypothetical protein